MLLALQSMLLLSVIVMCAQPVHIIRHGPANTRTADMALAWLIACTLFWLVSQALIATTYGNDALVHGMFWGFWVSAAGWVCLMIGVGAVAFGYVRRSNSASD